MIIGDLFIIEAFFSEYLHGFLFCHYFSAIRLWYASGFLPPTPNPSPNLFSLSCWGLLRFWICGFRVFITFAIFIFFPLQNLVPSFWFYICVRPSSSHLMLFHRSSNFVFPRHHFSFHFGSFLVCFQFHCSHVKFSAVVLCSLHRLQIHCST